MCARVLKFRVVEFYFKGQLEPNIRTPPLHFVGWRCSDGFAEESLLHVLLCRVVLLTSRAQVCMYEKGCM